MTKKTIFIDGSEGTTGLQIRERIKGFDTIMQIKLPPELRKDVAARKEVLNDADIVVLCLPDAAAKESVSLIENPNVRVIDASTAHRTNPAWVYGFPELTPDQADLIHAAKRVANPGCYATGAIALLAPLVSSKLLSPHAFYAIHGVSGYSGGGRKTIELCEGKTDAPLPPHYQMYALSSMHKHVPEIVKFAGLKETPLFTPSIANDVPQGMIVQIPVCVPQCGAEALHKQLSAHYADQPMVTIMPYDASEAFEHGKLALDGLAGKDTMELYVTPYDKGRKALLLARLDNLGKGASGAAVQNLKLMLG